MATRAFAFLYLLWGRSSRKHRLSSFSALPSVSQAVSPNAVTVRALLAEVINVTRRFPEGDDAVSSVTPMEASVVVAFDNPNVQEVPHRQLARGNSAPRLTNQCQHKEIPPGLCGGTLETTLALPLTPVGDDWDGRIGTVSLRTLFSTTHSTRSASWMGN